MFKNMKLAAKISLGFGLLIVIALLLGGLATWSMLKVKTITNMLAFQNVPAVGVASNIERCTQSAMYATRGYAFTEDEKYLTTANENFELVKKYLKESKDHATKYNLAVLKENTEKAEAKTLEYIKLQDETVAKTNVMNQNLKACTDAATEFMQAYDLLLDSQQKSQCKEFADANANAEKFTERAKKIALVNNVLNLYNTVRINNWRSQNERDPKIMAEALKSFDAINKTLDELKEITRIDADLKAIEACCNASDKYKKNLEEFSTNWIAREELGNQRGLAADGVLEAAKASAEFNITKTTESSDNAANSLSVASTTMIIGLCIAIIVGISLAIFITRSITKPINRIIAGLTDGAEQVASASGQVSAASQSLAEGATEQAAGLEETSSSLEEMSSMTKQNADNAQQANTLAGDARKAANNGTEAMSRMSTAIKDIQKSSDETAKIIKVIDEIAFQTNLLALNAAVEAARAGEAGKGFAVVAEEVRNLAMRSAEAAKNTANMIEESVKNSKNGVDIATEVGKVLDEIVQSIGKTTDLVGEIAAASSEQAQGIDNVNAAVSQMDKVTQQNAANAEESASASEELSAQAEQMNQIVQELVNLVGGSGTTTKRTHSVIANHNAAQKTHELVAKNHEHKLTTLDHAIHHIAGGTDKKTEKKVTAVSKAKAAKTIPLDNNNDDLKNFNS
jgi:methyl-accepting chemotaxis protein